ncbi:MAG TPA: O-antigen ligase family protein [Terriglobales bacterium]|nr:O-antigen ligase family protein [Terriglobales bacterium]
MLAAEIAVLGWLAATEGTAAVSLFGIVILGLIGVTVAVTVKWPAGAVFTLVIASAMPRLALSVFGLHLRPEHVAIGLVLVVLCVQMLRHKVEPLAKVHSFDYFLIAYVALNFLTSAITSPEPRMTLRWAVLNAIVIAPFFLLRFLLTDIKKTYRAMEVLLWCGAAESVIGIVCFLSNKAFHTTFGLSTEQYGFIPGVYGTQYEANIFGSYSGCCAIMFLAFFLLSHKSRRGRYMWGMSLCLLGALISLARSVLLALPIAAALVLWVVYKSGRVQFRSLVRLTAVLAVLVLVASPFLLNFVVERFSTIDFNELSSDSSTITRLVQTAAGLEDIRTHPLFGTGTDSFQLFFDWNDYMPGMGGDTDAGGWLGNTPLRILHDTGIVGLLIFLSFLGSLALATRKAFKIADPRTRTMLLALSGGLVLYAVTFQATEATMLAFTWVHFGVLAAIVQILPVPGSRDLASSRN